MRYHLGIFVPRPLFLGKMSANIAVILPSSSSACFPRNTSYGRSSTGDLMTLQSRYSSRSYTEQCKLRPHNPANVPPGEYRRVVKIDQNGMKQVDFIGQRHFVHEFTRPGRRVVSFMHRYNTSGVAFR